MAALLNYIVKRSVQGAVTILVVTLVIFLLFHQMPGSIIDNFRADPTFNRAKLAQLNETFGVNDPFFVKMYKFVPNMFTFNFGPSYLESKPVVDVLREALPRTLFLFGGAVIIEYLLGILLGRYIAWKRGRFSEGATVVTSLFFYNMPSFWIGLILLYFFAFVVDWFPLRGYSDLAWTDQHYAWLAGLNNIQLSTVLAVVCVLLGVVGIVLGLRARSTRREVLGGGIVAAGAVVLAVGNWNFSMFDFADIAIHAFLPMLALVLISSAGTILLMQTSMLEVMGEDFILTARAKGLSERVVRSHHAARNAYLPIVTSLAISLGFVIGGAIVLEQIFSYYGAGWYFLQAVTRHDYFLAGADLFLISVLVIAGNIIADIMYGVLDPRVRL
ncbi:MAG TPA: ABC transporter permease [Thermoplasmata archaeon]|nr:ABC transporter permease [Thermoplasmata archaeon]